MDGAAAEAESHPDIELEQVSLRRDAASERWNISWRIKNLTVHPMRMDSVVLPHGQFKAEKRRFEPALHLAGGENAAFHTAVRCEEPEGPVTENAFLIFQVQWLDRPWRVFVRVKVAVNSQREPHAAVELITTQQVGFSGAAG